MFRLRRAVGKGATGMDGILQSNFEESKKLLREAGYDGKPIVLMADHRQSHVLTNLAPVGEDPAREGRLQGRHAVDGLADAGVAPGQEGTRSTRAAGTFP